VNLSDKIALRPTGVVSAQALGGAHGSTTWTVSLFG